MTEVIHLSGILHQFVCNKQVSVMNSYQQFTLSNSMSILYYAYLRNLYNGPLKKVKIFTNTCNYKEIKRTCLECF